MKSVLGSAYFNLLKTILGCGILVYPSLYKNYGIIPTTVLTLISGFFSLSGLFLYVLTNKIINKKSTMSTIARYSIPSLRYVVDVVVILKCFFVTVSYMIFLKEIIPYGFGKLGFEYFVERKELGLLVCLLVSLPVNLLRKIDGLKFTSIFGIGSVIFILLTSFYRLSCSESGNKIYYFTKNFSYYKSLGEFVFGFTCHQNIFTIQNEMEGVGIWELNLVMFLAILTASLIYILFGIINYKIFGELIEGNFLNILNDDKLKVVTVVIYGIMILISIPLQVNPCRLYFLNIFNVKYSGGSEYGMLRNVFTVVMLGISYFIAISKINFQKVVGLVGGTFSTAMCFIFSSLFFLCLKETHKKGKFKILACTVFLWGILVFVGLFISKIQDLF